MIRSSYSILLYVYYSLQLFELREKYNECKDLLDCAKAEVEQLKMKSSPRVPTHRYYTGPCYIPPEGSLAAELESLHSGDRDLSRFVHCIQSDSGAFGEMYVY